MKTELLSLTFEEMQALLEAMGQPRFRAGQLFTALHKGVKLEEITTLPKAFRESLALVADDQSVHIHQVFTSAKDGTQKYLFALRDGNIVEGVLMHYEHGATLCLSTQVGCNMGCVFCASTLEGCVRNLTAGEMLGQIIAVNALKGAKTVSNVVLMGSGEPLDNYENVIKFLRLAHHEKGMNLSLRGMSLSTCGMVPQMFRLAEEGLPVTLCVSLHAPTDGLRQTIMPTAKAYPLEDILRACRNYIEKTGRRVIFEYALMGGINDGTEAARALSHLLRALQCHVNVITLNPIDGHPIEKVSAAQADAFIQELKDRHISVTRRREMGTDIAGACGQLRRRVLKPMQTEE